MEFYKVMNLVEKGAGQFHSISWQRDCKTRAALHGNRIIKKRGDKITLGDYALCSNTTLRHCKEALRQWGYGPMSKKEIANTFEWERF